LEAAYTLVKADIPSAVSKPWLIETHKKIRQIVQAALEGGDE